jgi:hypothetical protein
MFVDPVCTRHLQQFFAAGADTVGVSYPNRTHLADFFYSTKTVSSMTSLFLALVLYPQVQKRAQEELDLVVGRDRFPTFDDRPRLPYIEAICRELMRWQMVTPLGSAIPCHDTQRVVKCISSRSPSRVHGG